MWWLNGLDNFQLDIVGFLAVLGEGSVQANAQVSALSRLFVSRCGNPLHVKYSADVFTVSAAHLTSPASSALHDAPNGLASNACHGKWRRVW